MSTPLEVPPGFDEASNEQRIAFVQELWDRIAANPQRVPVPPEHRRVLEERLAAYRTDPEPGRPWSEVREELLRTCSRPSAPRAYEALSVRDLLHVRQ